MGKYKYSLIILIAFVFFYTSGVSYAVYTLPTDRTITWQGNVGVTYRGGIPARTTICATIDSVIYGSGTVDASTAINNAISACPNGQTVYIPAGTYRINSKIIIPKTKSITLRGAGPGNTIIKSYISGYWSRAIDIGSDPNTSFGAFQTYNYCPQTAAPAGYVQNITGGAILGSTSITLSDATTVAVGDHGIINVLNNNDSNVELWTQSTNIGQEDANSIYGFCCSSGATCRSLGQVVEVTGKADNTITVNPPLYAAYGTMLSPQFSVIKSSDIAKDIGLENFTIENAITPPDGAYTLIHITASRNVWMKNIETNKAASRHIWVRYGSLYTELRDSHIHHSLTFTSSNYGIELDQWVSGALIENNIFNETMTSIIFGGAASGNVAAYNYVNILRYTSSNTWLQSFVAQHAAHSWMNLLEGNWGTEVLLDQIHGTNSHFTAFRNYLRYDSLPNDGYTKTQNVAIYVEKGSRLHNFIGNILGYSGFPYRYESNGGACSNSGSAIYTFGYAYGSYCTSATWDPKSESTTIRHGNYDYVNNLVIWNGSDDRTLPSSLYLTSKPSWWGNLIWPSIGPDISGYVASIPAKDRFLGSTPPPISNFSPNQIIEAESGQLTSMQTGTSGSDTYIYTNTNDIGSAKYTFDIPTSGQYKMEAKVNTDNDGGQNSFYVGLDNESAQGNILYAYNIFPLTAGFIWDEVSKWGNGQTGNPPISQFDPIIWNLTQGTHSFTFYGRESNTWLDQIKLVPVITDTTPPSAPTGLNVN